MKTIKLTLQLIIVLLTFTANNFTKAQSISSLVPDKFFGFTPGADSMLFDYEQLIDYLTKLDKVSERMKMVEIGKSPLGKPMYIAFISSEANIKNLDKLKEINKKLALEPNLSERDVENLADEGKVFFLATLSMHSTEVAPSQAAPLIAYELVTTNDKDKLKWLGDVVYMLVPNHNPDGMDMVVQHYKKYKGTKYDGSAMPGVYHKYVGHDNNRDFVTLTQSDTRAISAIYSTDWFPQVMIEKHQMGSTGPRYFVPPMHDPIAENIDAGIFDWTWVFGSCMTTDLTQAGLKGVTQHAIFDDYWPGATETCLWKGVIGMLTEAASVNVASPIYIEPNELQVSGKGLSEYEKSINMLLPWEGGWWRLGDIVQYELVSTYSIMKTASLHRNEILQFRNDMCRKEVNKGKTQAPYYYIFPIAQSNADELIALIDVLQEHGISVYKLNKDIVIENKIYKQGDIVVPLAQPFRSFIKEILEKQVFPARHYTPDGELIQPYDITSWSLSLHKGLDYTELNEKALNVEPALDKIVRGYKLFDGKIPANVEMIALQANLNTSYKIAFSALQQGVKVERTLLSTKVNNTELPAGSFIIPKNGQTQELISGLSIAPVFSSSKLSVNTAPVTLPRIALIETWFHDMDAGWTRYVFDTYSIPFKVIRPGEFAQTDFAANFDVLVFPSASKDMLLSGKRKSGDDYVISNYPPEFTKGIGTDGMKALMQFIDKGGIVLSWGQSTNLFIGALTIERSKDDKEEFQLPIRDISEGLVKNGLSCPGSLVKVIIKQDHPLTYGMPKSVGVFFRGRPVFATSQPSFDADRRVIATFPKEQILMSGYCEKEELLSQKSAMVWLKKGKGQVILCGFNPQQRASTTSTYKLIFNSLLLQEL